MRGGSHRLDRGLERGVELFTGLALWVALVFFGGVRASELACVTGLLGAAALLWVARLWSERSPRWILHPVLAPLLGFVGYAAWRATGADVPYHAWREVWLVGLYVLTFLLALQGLHSQETLQRTAAAGSVAGALLGIYALGQFLGESDSVLWLTRPAQYVRRAGATFVNPNHLAALLVLLLPMSMAQAFLARSKPLARVLHGYAALMMLGGVAVTMSRGGWLAAGLVLAAFLGWMAGRRPNLRIPAIVLMSLVASAAVAFLALNAKARQRIEGIGAQGIPDSGDRLPLWRPAVAMWRDHPWTGVGPAHYDVWYPKYRDVAIQASPGNAHNEYLNTLADYGVAGTVLALTAVLVLAASAWFSRKYVERGTGDLGDKGSNRAAFFTGSTLGLAGLAVHSAGEFAMHVPALGLMAMLWAGQLASLARFASDRWWFSPGFTSRILASAAMLLSLAWLLPKAWISFHEARLLGRAHRAVHVDDAMLRDLEAAAALCPGNPRTAFELGDNLRRMSLLAGAAWASKADEAIRWLGKSASLNPHDPAPHMALAEAWYWKGDPDKAIASSAHATQLAPRLVAAANLHGWILFQRRDYSEARRYFQQSLEWNPWDNHVARAHLAACDDLLARQEEKPKP